MIALAIDGKSYTSVGFAEHVKKVMLKGTHGVCHRRITRFVA